MTMLFYVHVPGAAIVDAQPPVDVSIRHWRPAIDGPPRRGPMRMRNLCWWGMDRLGIFEKHGFTEISLWRWGRMLHRLVLTPRWHRFPFMAPGDLQIGDLWTAPAARRRGLARAAIAEAHRLAGSADRLWYVVDERNAASIALIEACGYRRVGTGRRTRPLGVALVGRFELERLSPARRG